MTQSTQMPVCPMSQMCKGMMEKPRSAFWMMIPAILLILLGVAVIVYPKILIWLVAAALIFMGLAMLMMMTAMRHMGHRFQSRPH